MAKRPASRPCAAWNDSFVLLENSLAPGGVCRLMEDPVEIIRCDGPEDIENVFRALERGLARGLSAAGFFSYELGYLMEPKLAGLLPARRDVPLMWFGLFASPKILNSAAARDAIAHRRRGDGHTIRDLRLGMDRTAYVEAVARVKDYIAAGDVYQINLTFKVLFEFEGDPLSLYAELRRKQRVAHGGLVHGPDFDILSISPELFLAIKDRQALTRPMKGTAARAATPWDDAAIRAWLRGDEKSRAENLMIVDLLRNDLGRVAEIGSVAVPDLFTIETYPTVHQMTSSVTGRLRDGIGPRELVRGLFPCGSITGAPKVRAMEIIHELETGAGTGPRGIYTGAIGMFGPDGEVALNVAIRTAVLHCDGRGEMGIGSGIVHDSDPDSEFEECLLKARFLTAPELPFRLIETLAWTPEGGYALLDRHMARLAASSAYFGYPCAPDEVRAALLMRAEMFPPRAMRVRLLLNEEGQSEISARPLADGTPATPWRFAISPRPVARDNPFLYHKTTRRDFFEGELARLCAETGCDEVVFVNDRGEVTEGSRTNVFVERDGRLLTPPVSCGLLNGTLRQSLLDDPGSNVIEQVLTPGDLSGDVCVYLGNSVRGLVRARLASSSRSSLVSAAQETEGRL